MIAPEMLVSAEDAVEKNKRALREAKNLVNALTANEFLSCTIIVRAKALYDDIQESLSEAVEWHKSLKGMAGCTCPNPVLHWQLAQQSKQTKIDPTQCMTVERNDRIIFTSKG